MHQRVKTIFEEKLSLYNWSYMKYPKSLDHLKNKTCFSKKTKLKAEKQITGFNFNKNWIRIDFLSCKIKCKC